MAKRRRGKRQSNRSPQRWLAMSLYPAILAVLFFGVTLGGWAAEAVQSDPTVKEDFDDRDADDWLEKLGITELDDPGGIEEAALEDIIDALGLDIDIKDLEKGDFDDIDLDALGLGGIAPEDITKEDIINRINELIEQEIAKNTEDTDDSDSGNEDEISDDNSDDLNGEDSEEEISDESDDEETDDAVTSDDSEDEDIDESDDSDDEEAEEPEEEEETDDSEDEEYFSQYYYYNFCSAQDKVLYKEVYEIFRDRKSYTAVSTSDTDKLDHMYDYVMADHPEFFYVWGSSWYNSSGYVTFKGNYTYNEAELLINKELNEAAAQQIADSVPVGLTEYETIKYFYNYLVSNTTYDLGSEWNQEISSVFINHVSVCAGYARAMQYLLQLRGIQCLYIVGDAGGPHAWNVVRVDGKYYQLDVCWADPNNPQIPDPNYAYLCIPTSRICKNHTVDEDTNPIPECNSMDANYYVQEDLYLESFDTDRIAQIFEKSKIENRGVVYIMAADAGTYSAMKNYLIDQRNAGYLYYGESGGAYCYLVDDNMYTLMIYPPQ